MEKTKLEEHERDIMDAVGIIKEFGPIIKAMQVMVRNNDEKIKDEKENREKEDNEIKDNYLKRFEEIKQDIKDLRNEVRTFLISITSFFLLTILGLILAKIGGLL